ncbi:outer membrane protein W [Striga asiatica]|uniref:Outer membrane protein W n=1 Tax=Striga asiatica TaxID=4170 RepID=A0A5A7Q1U1_STRAF|nr:outer membrane protein W [Striga asiatica]
MITLLFLMQDALLTRDAAVILSGIQEMRMKSIAATKPVPVAYSIVSLVGKPVSDPGKPGSIKTSPLRQSRARSSASSSIRSPAYVFSLVAAKKQESLGKSRPFRAGVHCIVEIDSDLDFRQNRSGSGLLPSKDEWGKEERVGSTKSVDRSEVEASYLGHRFIHPSSDPGA